MVLYATNKKQSRSSVNHSIGIELLLEILGWDSKTIDPSKFKKPDYRGRLLEMIAALPDWRDQFRDIQNEIRGQLLNIFEPAPINRASKGLPSDRAVGTMILFKNIWALHWQQGLFLGNLAPIANPEKGAKFSFEINGEKLEGYEGVAFHSGHSGFKQRLYWILYNAFKTGEISKLRICNYQACRKFFVPARKGKHCSEQCRTRSSNQERQKTGDFEKYYETRKKNRIKKAKKLLDTGAMIPDVIEATGLTYKGLQKAGLIKSNLWR